MRRILVQLLFFVLSFCFIAGAEARNYALLVGVDDYCDSKIGNLKCCVKDMKDLKEALKKIGFKDTDNEKDICVLTSEFGDMRTFSYKERFDTEFKNILKNAKEDDFVIIAFSGHGVRKGNQDYFCPWDAKLNNIEGTCISITQVMADLNNCKAKLKLIVVDACRSSSSTKSAFNSRGIKMLKTQGASVFQEIPGKAVPDGIWLFQSCGKGQVSYEEKQEGGNGYFMKNFVASLSSFNDNGELKLLTVLSNTINNTQSEVQKLNKAKDKGKEQGKDKEQYKKQEPHFTTPSDSTDILLYKDEKYPEAEKLVKEGDEAKENKNDKLAYEKYKEALDLCSYVKPWKDKLKSVPNPLVTVPDDYATIDDAYAHVTDNGTIAIRPGKYELRGTLVVNRPVTIQGISEQGTSGRAEDVIINCKSEHAFHITEGRPSFRNLTVNSEAELCSGFCITGGSPEISHCIIKSFKETESGNKTGSGMCVIGINANPIVDSCFMIQGQIGLLVKEQGHGKFNDCVFFNNCYGIFVESSGNPTVTKCKIYENIVGVNVENISPENFIKGEIVENASPENFIKDVNVENKFYGDFDDCEIYKNECGIMVRILGNPTITKCKIYENQGCVVVTDGGRGNFKDCDIYNSKMIGIYVDTSGNPTFTKCNIRNGKSYGILVQNNGCGQFQGCEIYGNALSGIEVFKSGNPTFTKCKIHDGESAGVVVKYQGRGQFIDCEIYGNAEPGIAVFTSGDPTVSGCKIHDGKSAGTLVKNQGLGQFQDCEIYGNAMPGILVHASGKPTVTGCKIHDGKFGGVYVYDKGKGTFNNNTLENNYKKGQLYNWDIRPDAGQVIGSENTPPIPERKNSN